MKDKYQKTIYACFIGYVVQAVVNNFVPLLFLTFEKTYGIPLRQITMLITLQFRYPADRGSVIRRICR